MNLETFSKLRKVRKKKINHKNVQMITLVSKINIQDIISVYRTKPPVFEITQEFRYRCTFLLSYWERIHQRKQRRLKFISNHLYNTSYQFSETKFNQTCCIKITWYFWMFLGFERGIRNFISFVITSKKCEDEKGEK